MEADRITASFQDHTFQIIVEQDTRYTLPCLEGGDVAAQEVLHTSVKEEAQEDLARVAQHHDERHQRTACPAEPRGVQSVPTMPTTGLCRVTQERPHLPAS